VGYVIELKWGDLRGEIGIHIGVIMTLNSEIKKPGMPGFLIEFATQFLLS
jgi:hypothetical protein